MVILYHNPPRFSSAESQARSKSGRTVARPARFTFEEEP